MEWLLNSVNKGKYKRNVFVSYLLLSFLLYNSFWDFLGQGITPTNQCGGKIKLPKYGVRYSNGNTALPFARDLQASYPTDIAMKSN